MSAVFTTTQTFTNLSKAGKQVNLTVHLGTGTLAIRRVLTGSNVDVPVTASGVYALLVNDLPVTIVVTGDAKYSLD